MSWKYSIHQVPDEDTLFACFRRAESFPIGVTRVQDWGRGDRDMGRATLQFRVIGVDRFHLRREGAHSERLAACIKASDLWWVRGMVLIESKPSLPESWLYVELRYNTRTQTATFFRGIEHLPGLLLWTLFPAV